MTFLFCVVWNLDCCVVAASESDSADGYTTDNF